MPPKGEGRKVKGERIHLLEPFAVQHELFTFRLWLFAIGLVGLTGIEPVTSSLSGTRSNQLSYKPMSFCERDMEQLHVCVFHHRPSEGAVSLERR